MSTDDRGLRRVISEALREAYTWSEATQAVFDAVTAWLPGPVEAERITAGNIEPEHIRASDEFYADLKNHKLPASALMDVGIGKPPVGDLMVNGEENRVLLNIAPDGTVTGAIEDMSEAGAVFVKYIRQFLPSPEYEYRPMHPEFTEGLKDQFGWTTLPLAREVVSGWGQGWIERRAKAGPIDILEETP